MHDSTTPATPYEVLGVSAAASDDDLRRAYRRKLRETHPDTGGEAVEFHAVQHAWELIGTPADRAEYDRTPGNAPASGPQSASDTDSTAPASSAHQGDAEAHDPFAERAHRTRDMPPPARSYGHPGGFNREQYFLLMREWVGRGAHLDNPYDQDMVRASPREIRHLLADAVAEEQTATALTELGIAFTIWHDIAADVSGAQEKLDHIVLGPTGLFGLLSEDWAGPIGLHKGEITGSALAPGERPMRSLARRARAVARASRLKFTALAVIVPDSAYPESFVMAGRERGVPVLLVHASRLQHLMQTGVGAPRLTADEIFAMRDRLQETIRFV